MSPQLERLGEVLVGLARLAEISILVRDSQISPGKIRIKLDRTLKVRQGGGRGLPLMGLADGVSFQSFQRVRGGWRQWSVKLLNRSQRFAQFAAQLGRRLAQRVEDFLLGRSRNLLLGQHVPAQA